MNIGVIGSGFIVGEFVECSKRFKEYNLRGIWGRHREKLDKFKDDFSYVTTDLDMLLCDPVIDVIYVALPNGLHYEYAMKALKAGKDVLLEKPYTVNSKDARKLINYANKHNLMCIEAITTRYNPVYLKMKKEIDKLGDIKMINCNFSQYSRRYNSFKSGKILPVFNKKLAGGALLDLNVYNIHFTAMMFGMPKKINYFPNMNKGVDTSGVLILDYGNFKARLIACKDCGANNYAMVEGDEGYMITNSSSSRCAGYTVKLNNGKEYKYDGIDGEFVGFESEFKAFAKLQKNRDEELIKSYNNETLMVVKILEKALESANIKY